MSRCRLKNGIARSSRFAPKLCGECPICIPPGVPYFRVVQHVFVKSVRKSNSPIRAGKSVMPGQNLPGISPIGGQPLYNLYQVTQVFAILRGETPYTESDPWLRVGQQLKRQLNTPRKFSLYI